ncbi:hypothetical protein B4Q13_22745 [Lacticaseibacillus rhamnosus]
MPFSGPASAYATVSKAEAAYFRMINEQGGINGRKVNLIVYDEHGGIYDHVPPPACMKDGFVAQPNDTGTGRAVEFDRLRGRGFPRPPLHPA